MTGFEIGMVTIGAAGFALQLVHMAWTQAVAGRTRKIDTLEADLKAAATKAIDEKLATLRAEQSGPIMLLNQQIEAIQRRLEFGEERFRKLEEKDHALQIEVLRAINDLKDVVATKDDLERLREEMRR